MIWGKTLIICDWVNDRPISGSRDAYTSKNHKEQNISMIEIIGSKIKLVRYVWNWLNFCVVLAWFLWDIGKIGLW